MNGLDHQNLLKTFNKRSFLQTLKKPMIDDAYQNIQILQVGHMIPVFFFENLVNSEMYF